MKGEIFMAEEKNFLPVPKTFEHELFGKIRYLEDGDELWFVAADVAKALDLTNVRKNLADFPDDEKGVTNVYTLGGPQKWLLSASRDFIV